MDVNLQVGMVVPIDEASVINDTIIKVRVYFMA